jgi:hypothetical protein
VRFRVIDIETTGLASPAEIIAIGGLMSLSREPISQIEQPPDGLKNSPEKRNGFKRGSGSRGIGAAIPRQHIALT